MAHLEVRGLSKSFEAVSAVERASLEAGPAEILGLLGASGCGKTTLLRLIAGIEEADEGEVSFGGEQLGRLPPQARGFGLMFQDLALFPHMDVFGNVAFGLRMQCVSKDAVRERVHELLSLVNMRDYAGRKVHELSGGERQRVALARALAPAPRMLMLDEPLGALDRALRDTLQGQVRAILKEVGVTAIYVTHDRDEAFAVADRLLFMDRGRIVRAGTPEEVYNAPESEFVARTLGFKNILAGVVARSGELVDIECAVGTIRAARLADSEVPEGEDVLLLIEEKGITPSMYPKEGQPAVNVVDGTVAERVFRGVDHELKVNVGRGVLYCAAPTGGPGARLRPGDRVSLEVDPCSVKLLKGG